MKTVKFKSITIENFKWIDKFYTDFKNNTIISGPNESGKTSFVDAIYWCLTGEDSFGRSRTNIIRIGEKSCAVNLWIGFEGEDREHCISRVEDTKEKSTITAIDGIRYKSKEFEAWLANNLCSKQILKLLINPKYFTEYIKRTQNESVQDIQRKIIFEIADIEDNDCGYKKWNEFLKDCLKSKKELEKNAEFLYQRMEVLQDTEKKFCMKCSIHDMLKEQIHICEEERKEVIDRLAKTQENIDTCKDMLHDKYKEIEYKINFVFSSVSFKLYEETSSGDFKDCFEIYYNYIPYENISFSAKFMASSEIVEAISEKYGIEFPVIVDNAESIDYKESIKHKQCIEVIKILATCPKCSSISVTRPKNDGYSVCKKCNTKFKRKIQLFTCNERGF